MTGIGWVLGSLLATAPATPGAVAPLATFDQFVMRGDLMRSYHKLAAGGPARVAFMGGSVTTRQWREPVMNWLRARFPNTEFDFIMAGIGGTDANLGAFRLRDDVFGRGPVDLFLLEFAVNGGGIRAMEGIVRQARRLSPAVDIMLLYFANTGHVAADNDGKTPGLIAGHEQVAERYGLPGVYLYREVAQRIRAGGLTWEQFSTDSVHPTQAGCDLYAECLLGLLEQAWSDPAKPASAASMPEPLDPGCYQFGRYADPRDATAEGFTWQPGWRTTEATVNFRPPVDLLAATEPGATLRYRFTGTTLGAYFIVGFDAGRLSVSIDGQPARVVELFDHYCERFHRPQHKILADDLATGEHEAVLTLLSERHDKATGTAARIVKLMVNGEAPAAGRTD